MGKVDGFGDFRVSLAHGFAGFVGHHGEQSAAVVGQCVGRVVEVFSTFRACLRCPIVGVGEGALHRGVDNRRVGDHVGFDGSRIGGEGRECPGAVGGQCRVGVGFAAEVPWGGTRATAQLGGFLLGTVLGAARSSKRVPAVTHGFSETLLLVLQRRGPFGPHYVGREQRVQEVLLRPVFFKATHQVGHGNVEIFGVHHRRVQDQPAHNVPHRAGLRRCHALQHFHIQLLFDAPGYRKLMRQRHGVQVVAGHADAHVIGVLWLQDVIEQPNVVGIYLFLGEVGGLFPVVDLRLYTFHGQVRAFDQANFDLGAALLAAFFGKRSEGTECFEGVRQIRLEYNPRLKVEEFFLAEQFGEEFDGEVEVLVFLHIHVDKGMGAAL